MGKSVKAPPSPDYAGAAAAQGTENRNAALQGSILSNPNIRTPWGNQTVNFDETGRPTIYQDLPPTLQAATDLQNDTTYRLSGLANQQAGRIYSVLNTPFSGNAEGLQTEVNPNQGMQIQQAPTGQDYGMAQAGQANPNTQEQFAGGVPQASTGLNESGNVPMPINAGVNAQQLLMQRLQPQLDQQRKSYENQLAQQGLVPGGEAYNNAIRNLGQQENDQRTQAALQGINLDLGANQQGFNQALQRGQFGNQGVGQNFQQQLAAQQFGNQARQQNFGNAFDLQNQANAAIGQNFGQGLQSQQANNAAQQQGFNQALQGGQFKNQALQQQMAMALQQRQLPLNEIIALMSGSQIQNPSFSPFQGQEVAPAPTFAGTQAQGGWNQNVYNQQVAQRNSMMGGLFGLGGPVVSGLFGL